jgi:predicted phage-related endonuclease
MKSIVCMKPQGDRRHFIGGSDARIIMGQDEKALIRLWQEKRGEIGPEDLSANLIVQLGVATEDLNRAWYERNTGHAITAVQTRLKHPVLYFLAATLDGMVTETGAVYEAKFMLPWSFSEGAAAEKHMAQLQHNMWVTNARTAALSIITGGGKWVEIAIAADQLYSTSCLRRRRSFGAASSPGNALTCSGSCRPSHGSRGYGSSTWRPQTRGQTSPRCSVRPDQPFLRMNGRKPNSRD